MLYTISFFPHFPNTKSHNHSLIGKCWQNTFWRKRQSSSFGAAIHLSEVMEKELLSWATTLWSTVLKQRHNNPQERPSIHFRSSISRNKCILQITANELDDLVSYNSFPIKFCSKNNNICHLLIVSGSVSVLRELKIKTRATRTERMPHLGYFQMAALFFTTIACIIPTCAWAESVLAWICTKTILWSTLAIQGNKWLFIAFNSNHEVCVVVEMEP